MISEAPGTNPGAPPSHAFLDEAWPSVSSTRSDVFRPRMVPGGSALTLFGAIQARRSSGHSSRTDAPSAYTVTPERSNSARRLLHPDRTSGAVLRSCQLLAA